MTAHLLVMETYGVRLFDNVQWDSSVLPPFQKLKLKPACTLRG